MAKKKKKIQLVAGKRIRHFYSREMVAGLENELYFYEKQKERKRRDGERGTLMK